LSLARAAAVHLARSSRAYTLFATHYFELTELAGEFPGIANVHLDAVELHDKQRGEQLVFMHAVKEGPANQSFGLQVAALAGLPGSVIADAKRTLAELERGMHGHASAARPVAESSPQLGLFAVAQPSPVERALEKLDPDAMTPRQAHDALYQLRELLRD
jgi:DNA mismatch repair protein MutS